MHLLSNLSLDPALAALLLIASIAAAFDLRFRRIPNWLTLGGAAAGLALHTVLGRTAGLLASAEGLGLGFGVYLVLYCLHAMGAGDVKLMAAVGALAGPSTWWHIFLATAIAGGILAFALSLAKGRLRLTLWNVSFIVGELMHGRLPYYRRADLDVNSRDALKLPHALAILAGVAVTLCCVI